MASNARAYLADPATRCTATVAAARREVIARLWERLKGEINALWLWLDGR